MNELEKDDNIIGKIKFIAERQRSYAGWLNTIILIYLAFNKIAFKWYYLFAIPLYLILVWADIKYIYPAERTYGDKKSKVLMNIMKNGKRGQVE